MADLKILIIVEDENCNVLGCLNSIIKFAPEYKCVILSNLKEKRIVINIKNFIKNYKNLKFYSFKKESTYFSMVQIFIKKIDKSKSDLLFLSPYSLITFNSIQEMKRILDLSEKHAVVTPRSNKGFCISFPYEFSSQDFNFSYNFFKKYNNFVPPYYILDICFKFCCLLKRKVLDLFCSISEINNVSEFTYLKIINQYGYNGILSNHSYVFNSKKDIDEKYYPVKNNSWLCKIVEDFICNQISPYDYFLSLKTHSKPHVLIDLYSLALGFNGTTKIALYFLKYFFNKYSKKYEIYILIQKEADKYHKISKKYPNVLYAENVLKYKFDICYKPFQFLDFNDLFLVNRSSLKFVFCMQDIITIRCNYIKSNFLSNIFSLSLKYCDNFIGISNFAIKDTLDYFYNLKIKNKATCIYHGFFGDEDLSTDYNLLPFKDDFVLIFGNTYKHKFLNEFLDSLTLKSNNFVILGWSETLQEKNVYYYKSGQLDNKFVKTLIKFCKLIIFPSQYEGFGLIILDAIAFKRKILLYNSEINNEIIRLFNYKNAYFFNNLININRLIEEIIKKSYIKGKLHIRTFIEAIDEYDKVLNKVLNSDQNSKNLSQRWEEINSIGLYLKSNELGFKNKHTCIIKGAFKGVLKKFPRVYKFIKLHLIK